MSELVEWCVGFEDETGFHREWAGAQSVFGLTTAQKLVSKLGIPWEVRHWKTGLSPTKHAETREN